MTHTAAWVWVLYEKASCREASPIRVLALGGGNALGEEHFMGDGVYALWH